MSGMQVLDVEVERTEQPLAPAAPLVDRTLPGGLAHLQANRDRAVLRVDGVGTFEVEGGVRIGFAPARDAVPGAEGRFLRATVVALLLAQRGEFALHASVAELAGAAMALCGPSGVGKSTTVLRLEQRGHGLVTDDLTALTLGEDVLVEPLTEIARVFPHTAQRLGLDVSAAQHAAPKLLLPASAAAAVPLRAIVVLCRGEGIAVRRLAGAEAGWALVQNVYRGAVFRAIWEAEIFAWAGTVAARVPVYQLTRPRHGWTVDEVADAVERIAR